MFPTHYTFQYNTENMYSFLSTYNASQISITIIILVSIALYGCIYFLAPHIYSLYLTRTQKQEKEAKRNVIKDLIVMKEVQGELEKEIEQSLLNITLQGKGA